MRLALHQLRTSSGSYWRSRELAFFTFALPIVFFVLLGSVYGDDEIDSVDGSAYLLAGMLGYGVTATAFAGLAIITVIRREDGVLKRFRGTPLPPLGVHLRGHRVDAARLSRSRRSRSCCSAAFSSMFPSRIAGCRSSLTLLIGHWPSPRWASV